MEPTPSPQPGPKGMRALLLGGILPVVIFTVIEEYYGTLAGLIAGMVFGVCEIAWEYFNQKRVDPITLGGNLLLLVLGGISLVTKEGVWFKLQPSLIEAAMASVLVGSVLADKPLLVMMAKKQGTFDKLGPEIAPHLARAFKGLTARLGLFFLLHAVIAAWAALHWSTRAWAILKGVGFTVTIFLYMGGEVLLLRRRLAAYLPKRPAPDSHSLR